MPPAVSRVFISYSHDSPAHMDSVLELSDRLRTSGVDCQIDQYEEAPAEGWPRWCTNQVKESQFVLVICTDTYERRFDGKEELGKGKGVTFEGFVVTQELYNAQGKNAKFVPIVFAASQQPYIPTLLQGATSYDLSTSEGYEKLYRRLTRQPLITKPKLGEVKTMPARGADASVTLPKLQRKQEFIAPARNVPPAPTPSFMAPEGILQEVRKGPGSPMAQPVIRILEADNNKRGDLFGRLMEALVLALGYDRARLNIHKSGREIDIEATHRTESRRLIAECKAAGEPIGGADVNKFVGVLDAERRKHPECTTEGYFISLSGLTETAIEQEKDLGGSRFVFLDGARVVEQLIVGRILVSKQKAMELAGRCASSASPQLVSDEACELVAHEVGCIWIVYFTDQRKRTRFALIHADGSFIAPTLVQDIVAADRLVGGPLHSLSYLEPPKGRTTGEDKITEARRSYLDYLKKECGEIQLDGLPADQELGSRSLRLESMFVPLHLSKCSPLTGEMADIDLAKNAKEITEPDSRQKLHDAGRSAKAGRAAVGRVLGTCSRLAVLGLPGGGKSTLLKRIAIAYAFPERRGLIDDKLPSRVWLPLFLRCRQLERDVRSPIVDILGSISLRAEMPNDLADGFKLLVSRSLRDGSVLLLVDGLDEISSERDRVSFVHQLRTFLAIYPRVSLVVTSREAGFRVIGGALSAQCEHYNLCDFDEGDVNKLTLNWSKEVFGDTAKTRADSKRLSSSICANDRLMKLATNPLLLTTLLLVKRWVGGPLPTKRTILYQKAIEVLLMTWNVQGHEPLDLDEALPQLEYLAFSMLKDGEQAVSSRKLREVVSAARSEMPELLSWCKISVPEFIERVELRSSLLMQSGHLKQGSSIYPSYEFRHLTFQEYLAARAIVNDHYPGREESDNITGILKPYLLSDNWKEVVPLTAVLSGRNAQPLLKELMVQCQKAIDQEKPYEPKKIARKGARPDEVLAACLQDEVQAPPDLLKEAMRCLVHAGRIQVQLAKIRDGKYGPLLIQVAREEFAKAKQDLMAIGENLSYVSDLRMAMASTISTAVSEKIHRLIGDNDPVEKALGCLYVMRIAFTKHTSMRSAKKAHSAKHRKSRLTKKEVGIIESWKKLVLGVRRSNTLYLKCASLWTEIWLAHLTRLPPLEVSDLVPELVSLWKSSESTDLRYLASWLLATIPLIDRTNVSIPGDVTDLINFAKNKLDQPVLRFESAAAFALAYYLKGPWTDADLLALAKEKQKDSTQRSLTEYFESFANSTKLCAQL